ncbi:MAG: ABC transporter ATP-binding protein [Cytophagales bacterium]|jgi:ATP-binding cassette subfamily B multidrug efflux pump|nr:ABC transporter ATP-binding protein [Cytophagales bacterium]MCA6387244.1 ABC transporter ATP-binding protein [Cytophagales bacterium]MCA6392636.1 ABC transporter ATP-binding protein [Cytophagales bacterium]MCA6395796.1 ABC transporter ATP-binding protein [Cytophagales bacterium]MCA6398736.1 ABC transporter ATP-binding protein [Cytophagales bacterium]
MEKEKVSSGNIIDFKVLKRIMQFVKPYKGRFYFVIVLTFLLGILTPIRPMLIQYTLDTHVQYGNYWAMVNVMLIILGLLAVQSAVQYAHTYISGRIAQFIIRDIRIQLYEHLIKLRLRFFDKTPIGRLVTRTISDVETLSDVFSEGLAAMASDLLQIIFILAFMFWIDWKLTLVSLSTIPLMLLATYVFKEKIKVAFNDVRNAVSNLNSFVQEHITGMNIVQIFGSEKREFDKFKEINKEHRNAHLRSVLYYSVYFPIAEIIAAMGTGLLVWYGAKGIINMEATGITIGKLVSFIMFIQLFFRPIRMIADRYNTLQMGIVGSSRIINLLDDQTDIMPNGTVTPSDIKGQVKFDHVWFAYNEADYVLKDISLDIKPGETIALVGATGAGKSSIINLLNRFYEINRGSIQVDGMDIKELDTASLRKNIGVVLQDVFLFSDTIRYNITLGNKEVTDEMILHAADLVGARKFIDRLPGGLNYNVMERGATISVGQRQLLSFIRAMVYDPKILVLDEATSSVDSETEEMIQNAISKMMTNRTSIAIAHRLSTIQKADKIIVLDKGEIKESGSHDELLASDGFYAQLHKMQYKEIA